MYWLIAYDTREVFEFLKRKGRMLVHQGLRLEEMYHGKVYLIEPLQPESFMGYEKWKEKHGYGQR